MIVISGALVLVALVLLVVGVVGSELGFVYASIAVSLGALLALAVGVRQRRDEPLPVGDAGTGATPVGGPVPGPADRVEPSELPEPAHPRATSQAIRTTVPAEAEPTFGGAGEDTAPGSVVVLTDRGRYHRPECRYVRGIATVELLSTADATGRGYAACGVCKP